MLAALHSSARVPESMRGAERRRDQVHYCESDAAMLLQNCSPHRSSGLGIKLTREEYSGDGHNPKKSDTAQRKPPIFPSVSALCSACAQPRWESEWKFNIEDGVAFNNNNNRKLCKTGDAMKGKAGKGKKMSRGMGRVFYHRPAPVVLVSP